MSELSQANSPSQPPPDLSGENDIQRAALRDLVKLSADSATAESEIERLHQSQHQQAQRQLARAQEENAQQNESQKQQALAEYEQRLADVTNQHQVAVADLKSTDAALRQRIATDNDSVSQNIKSQYQQAVWLAESVFEATQNQIAKDYKKAKESHGTRGQELDELTTQSLEILALYGQRELAKSPPAVAPDAPVDTPALTPAETPAEEAPAPTGPPYESVRDAIKEQLTVFGSLRVPQLLVGFKPILLVLVVCIVPAILAQVIFGGIPNSLGTIEPRWKEVGYALGGSVVLCIVGGIVLRMLSRSHVKRAYIPLRDSLESARKASDVLMADARSKREKSNARAIKKRDSEVQAAKDKIAPYQSRATKNNAAAVNSAKTDYERRTTQIEEKQTRSAAEVEAWKESRLAEIDQSHARQVAAAQAQHDQAIAKSDQQHSSSRAELENRWQQGLVQIQTPIERSVMGEFVVDWNDPKWKQWIPPRQFPPRVRFGELKVDLKQITDRYPKQLALPPTFSVPATLSFPKQASMLIHTDHAGRAEAIRTQQMIMARLLTQLPPGRVRFTIIDPVGLGQNFAGFMHLADHDEALVGSRIWTESEHIQQQLANLTEHMETVIQKYLRNEFATIDEYNAQAGELAEPYRYLVIADFPVGFEGDTYRRLSSIATSGARCGVFTLIVRDTRQQLPTGAHMDELHAHSINLVRQGGTFIWKDEIFKQFPLTLDSPPGEEFLTEILDVVGRKAKEAKRVEVAFGAIAPSPEKLWTMDSRSELEVPIGRLGATRLQTMKLGRGVAQHALIAGKTGSGKSTLLHVLVTNLALWYGPDQVEFYLVDFKKGVEFKTYATHALPHARAIAVESDREFGLSVLQRIDAELTRRGEIFRKLGVQDLAAYRDQMNNGSSPMPRTLLMIDEFQEFFSEDDKLSQEASLLLDRLVRQGRAFGIHVLLGSQTIGGTSGLARSTIGQMAVRIALQTSEADSQLILGDSNSAARLLSRPGEAIYNDAGGLVEGNSPFQISWLADEDREVWLDRVREKSLHQTTQAPEPIVFEGNAPADITRNKKMARLIESPPTARPNAPLIWLGDPVAIKEPTSIALRRQSGANVLIIGQHEEPAMALTAAAMVGLALQHPPGTARVYLLDGTPADSSLAGHLPRIAGMVGHEVRQIDWRGVPEAIAEIAKDVQDRQSAERQDQPAIYLVVYGLQRYRMLRKSEESFGGFSMDEGDKKPQPDKQFADILREGPALGVHTIAWVDTAASIERTLDRGSMREFDNRVLFQMSAADSSNLIDSPAGNKLGFNRALSFSEEQGVMEKFRPYALPPKDWLERLQTRS